LKSFLKEKNDYLEMHSKASVDVAKKCVEEKINKLKLENYLSIDVSKENSRQLIINTDEQTLAKLSLLDGCYIIKSKNLKI
jgi:hypothetical protein